MSKIELLQSVPIFSDLRVADLERMSEKMVTRSYGKGRMILLEESLGETFFILTSGSVKITRVSDEGSEVILAILGEGDFFGEMSLLDGEARSANVVALEDSEAMTLKRSDFLDFLEHYPKIAIHLLEELATRIRKSDQQIESLSLSDAEKRIAITLIRLGEELGMIRMGDVTINNLPFQQDIANMAGTSRETVSRTLKLLEERGYLSRQGRELIIHNFSTFKIEFS